MSSDHPLAPAVLPYCRKYPAQAGPLFQTFLDLSLAQGWSALEPVELEGSQWVLLTGTPKNKTKPAFVLPIALSAPTSIRDFKTLFASLARHNPPPPPPLSSFLGRAFLPRLPAHTPAPKTLPPAAEVPTVYLAMAEKDSSVVYYVLREGIVSPKEVPDN